VLRYDRAWTCCRALKCRNSRAPCHCSPTKTARARAFEACLCARACPARFKPRQLHPLRVLPCSLGCRRVAFVPFGQMGRWASPMFGTLASGGSCCLQCGLSACRHDRLSLLSTSVVVFRAPTVGLAHARLAYCSASDRVSQAREGRGGSEPPHGHTCVMSETAVGVRDHHEGRNARRSSERCAHPLHLRSATAKTPQ
jgi:hypothetical protein